jgi:hypothetical protein
MYMSSTLYQAERVKSVKEQREADVQTGQLAAEFGRLFRSPRRRSARGQRAFQRPAETAPACAACSGRSPSRV